jgi:hypothetical protein
MDAMTRAFARCAGAAAMLLMLAGCPLSMLYPPLNMTGAYSGVWEGVVEARGGGAFTCALTMRLEQDLEAPFPDRYGVQGILRFNFTCPGAFAALRPMGFPALITLALSGVQTGDGELLFIGGDCEEIDCRSVFFLVKAADIDGDAVPDALSGSFSFVVLADYELRTLVGTIEAARVE